MQLAHLVSSQYVPNATTLLTLLIFFKSRSRYDLYKQVLGLKFHDTLIKLVHNDDYVDLMANLGTLVHSRIKQFVSSFLLYPLASCPRVFQVLNPPKTLILSTIPGIFKAMATAPIIWPYYGIFLHSACPANCA